MASFNSCTCEYATTEDSVFEGDQLIIISSGRC